MKICDCTCIKRIVQWPKLSRKSQVHDDIFSDGGIRIWNVTECTTGQLLEKQLSWLEYSQEAQASECWANQLVQDSHCGPRGFKDLSFPGHKSVFTVAAVAHSRSAPGTNKTKNPWNISWWSLYDCFILFCVELNLLLLLPLQVSQKCFFMMYPDQ